MKILPVGAGMFHADGRTDITKVIIAFRDFANPPKRAHQCLIQLQTRRTMDVTTHRPIPESGFIISLI